MTAPRRPSFISQLLDRPRWAPRWVPNVDDERSAHWFRWLVVALLGFGLVAFVARAANNPPDPSVAPSVEEGPTDSPQGFESGEIAITSPSGERQEPCVLVAATDEQRAQGLMHVTDPTLGGHAGMLFRFPDDTTAGFWMRNTPQPLTVAYFDAGGEFVSSADMAPCGDDPECPTYAPESSYRWALEVVQGKAPSLGLATGSMLEDLGEACRPSS